jgi:snapalysin
VSCTNANPSSAERAEVNRDFAGATPQVTFNELHVDRTGAADILVP